MTKHITKMSNTLLPPGRVCKTHFSRDNKKKEVNYIDGCRFPYAAVAELAFGQQARRLVTFLIDATVFGAGIPNFILGMAFRYIANITQRRLCTIHGCDSDIR